MRLGPGCQCVYAAHAARRTLTSLLLQSPISKCQRNKHARPLCRARGHAGSLWFPWSSAEPLAPPPERLYSRCPYDVSTAHFWLPHSLMFNLWGKWLHVLTPCVRDAQFQSWRVAFGDFLVHRHLVALLAYLFGVGAGKSLGFC